MVEEAPKSSKITNNIFNILSEPSYIELFTNINREYYYWDKVKYLVPKDISPKDFWTAIKLSRLGNPVKFGDFIFSYKETNFMQFLLHEFDMNFGGTVSSENIISAKNKQYYLLSSIMEEAIASSQMEGASTTRKVAKDMLRKQAKPKDKSQQMILNNYNTIRFLSEHKDEKLTPKLFLTVHKMITEQTLDDSNDEGRFRTDDSIVVANGVTGEVAHEPPSYTQIKKMISEICSFANNDKTFIHPIIKAIIIHFMISFLHPFVDGNGRTARSFFYWYMLKKGYWLTGFLSISRIIYKSKTQYEKAFLYTEHDDFDLGYFIQYNLNVLKKAFNELQIYLERKAKEENAMLEFKNIPGINERQARIIKMLIEKPGSILISKELETTFNVSVKTIRADLESLVELKLVEKIPINKRLMGYARSNNFEKMIRENSGN